MEQDTGRIELQTDREAEERIARAARIEGVTPSEFATQATEEKADSVLGRHDHTVMPPRQFDLLMSTIDEPDPAPVLARLKNRRLRYDHR